MDVASIKAILAHYSDIRSEYSLLEAVSTAEKADQLRDLQKQVTTLDAWMGMMSREERFVICKHLVEKLSWHYVQMEYSERWGKPQSRNERTLKRYQANALARISEAVRKNNLTHDLSVLFAAALQDEKAQ